MNPISMKQSILSVPIILKTFCAAVFADEIGGGV
jgi:hypothetical protein